MNHAFNVEVATKVGLNEAIILHNLSFWIAKNKANNKHFYDGLYWTYNSIKAFNELFPYLSENKIRVALKKLEETGIIKTGNYNKLAYDRTLWYAITKIGESICENRQMEVSKNQNGFMKNDTPIPDINTDKKLNINTDSVISENSTNFTPHADDFYDVVDVSEPNDSLPKKESTSSARLEKINALIKRYEQAICDTTGKKYTLDTNKANQTAMKKLIELTGGDEQAIIETAKRSVRYYTDVGTSMHENGKNASGVFVNIGRLPAHVSKYSDILNASQYSKSSTNGMRPHRLASDIDPNMITPQ